MGDDGGEVAGGLGCGDEEEEVAVGSSAVGSVLDAGLVCSGCSVCSIGFVGAAAEDDDGSLGLDEVSSAPSPPPLVDGSFSAVCSPSLVRSSSTSLARKERQSG